MTDHKTGSSNLPIALLLIFAWPIGLIVMWATGAYSRKVRIAITLIFASISALLILVPTLPYHADFPTQNEVALDEDRMEWTETIEEDSEARGPERKSQMAPPPEPATPPEDKERYTLIRIMEEEIQPMRPVEFETGSHRIRSSSHPLLDEVARAIGDNQITKLLIGGHTDDVGSEADNMRLSQRRADAVRLYLQDKGVTADLMAIGFGKTRPVVNATTPETRAQNRRVEFQIMQRKIVVEKESGERNAPSAD